MTKKERIALEKEFNEKYAAKIKRMEEKIFINEKLEELRYAKKRSLTRRGLTTTKLMCYYLFIIFNIVLFYALVAMWHFADLSYLGVVISDIAGQVLLYMIYSIRAFKDTQSEENIKLERERLLSNNTPVPSTIIDPEMVSKMDDINLKIDSLMVNDNPEEDLPENDDHLFQ